MTCSRGRQGLPWEGRTAGRRELSAVRSRGTLPAVPKARARTLVLRPADPFDLIRWLARSQSDPRKAVAELVQNSIDARARHVWPEAGKRD